MIYKIYKRIDRTHRLNIDTQLYELVEKPEYYIKRKGKIFGFMHDVGDFSCDYNGNIYCILEKFSSLEQALSYLNCWHIEEYGENEPINIEYDLSVSYNE